MNSYLELIRVGNCIMAVIATLIGYFLVTQELSLVLLFGLISVFLICAGGQAINDVYDLEIDKKINKNKPIPSGRISRRNALIFSYVLFVIGICVSFLINGLAFIIAIVFSFLLIIYSQNLYKIKYIGNIVVALGTAFTFIFGASVTGFVPFIIFVFALSAFFANMAREVTKDFEDLKKDKSFKKTLPMISKDFANRIIVFYYFLSISFAISAYILFSLNLVYLFFVWLTTFVFLNCVFTLGKKDFKKSQSFSKKGMLLSLIAFISTIFR